MQAWGLQHALHCLTMWTFSYITSINTIQKLMVISSYDRSMTRPSTAQWTRWLRRWRATSPLRLSCWTLPTPAAFPTWWECEDLEAGIWAVGGDWGSLSGEGSKRRVWRCRRAGASAHPELVCIVFPVESTSAVTSLARKKKEMRVVCLVGPWWVEGLLPWKRGAVGKKSNKSEALMII